MTESDGNMMVSESPQPGPQHYSENGQKRAGIDQEQLINLLRDEYAVAVLETVASERLPAVEIAERLDISRATVYRRLNRLQEAGVVRATMGHHGDGHHRRRFEATVDEVRLSFDGSGVTVAEVRESAP